MSNDVIYAQINIKVPHMVKAEFDMCLTKRRESQREVLEHMISAYCCQTMNRSVLHLDGQRCPLDALIRDLATATKSQMEAASKPLTGGTQ